MPRRPTRGRSNRPTRRDIARAADRRTTSDDTDEGVDAYALLTAVTLGDPTEAEREQWEALDEDLRTRAVETAHEELLAGLKAAHSGGEH